MTRPFEGRGLDAAQGREHSRDMTQETTEYDEELSPFTCPDCRVEFGHALGCVE